jgi:hypothetical protein
MLTLHVVAKAQSSVQFSRLKFQLILKPFRVMQVFRAGERQKEQFGEHGFARSEL